jgi:hypothetical protein
MAAPVHASGTSLEEIGSLVGCKNPLKIRLAETNDISK